MIDVAIPIFYYWLILLTNNSKQVVIVMRSFVLLKNLCVVTLLSAVPMGADAIASTVGTIQLPYGDTIPDFGTNPTVRSVRSGSWSNPSTWSTGRIPQAGDIVDIMPTHTVTFDMADSGILDTVEIQSGGALNFQNNMTTKMTLTNALEVLAGGTLTIGTTANPVQAGSVAEIVFADAPMDLTLDPLQWGHGLIVMGKMTTSGSPMPDTFVHLAVEPKVGDTTLTLAKAVTGWNVGDKLVIPDTRQLNDSQYGSKFIPQWETVNITAISPDHTQLTVSAPLMYAHRGAHDMHDGIATLANGVKLMPHVMNLTRNVKIHSAKATQAYRGHAVFLNRADIDIRYTQFSGMGRTKLTDLESAVTANGFHFVNDRNSVQFRNLIGPAVIPANGHQYTFIGNSVFCPLDPMTFVWGININNSHYGLIQGNTLYNWAGAGLVTKTNNAYHNIIDGNFVLRTTGDFKRQDDGGTAGSGFWLNGVLNYVRNNVSADNNKPASAYAYGYYLYARFDGTITVPSKPGYDPTVSGQSMQINVHATPLPDFTNNEGYASPEGLSAWDLGTNWEHLAGIGGTIKDLHIWNNNGWGIFFYENNHITLDGYVDIGDKNQAQGHTLLNTALFSADYSTTNFIATHARFENVLHGVMTPANCGRWVPASDATYTIENSAFNNILQGQAVVIKGLSTTNGAQGLTPCTEKFLNNTYNTPGVYFGRSVNLTDPQFNLVSTNETTVTVQGVNGNTATEYLLYFDTNKPANAINDPKYGWSVKVQ